MTTAVLLMNLWLAAGAVLLRTLQNRWRQLEDADTKVAVLAVNVPKATALGFLITVNAPGDTFTSLVYGDHWDMVVYRDPLWSHELGSAIVTLLRDCIVPIFGGHKRFAAGAGCRSFCILFAQAVLLPCSPSAALHLWLHSRSRCQLRMLRLGTLAPACCP